MANLTDHDEHLRIDADFKVELLPQSEPDYYGFFDGALAVAVKDMRVAPLGAGDGRFVGVAMSRTVFGRVIVRLAPFVMVDATVVGVTGSGEEGRTVYCSTDNPSDLTLYCSPCAHRVGVVCCARGVGRADVLAMIGDESLAARLAKLMIQQRGA